MVFDPKVGVTPFTQYFISCILIIKISKSITGDYIWLSRSELESGGSFTNYIEAMLKLRSVSGISSLVVGLDGLASWS